MTHDSTHDFMAADLPSTMHIQPTIVPDPIVITQPAAVRPGGPLLSPRMQAEWNRLMRTPRYSLPEGLRARLENHPTGDDGRIIERWLLEGKPSVHVQAEETLVRDCAEYLEQERDAGTAPSWQARICAATALLSTGDTEANVARLMEMYAAARIREAGLVSPKVVQRVHELSVYADEAIKMHADGRPLTETMILSRDCLVELQELTARRAAQ